MKSKKKTNFTIIKVLTVGCLILAAIFVLWWLLADYREDSFYWFSGFDSYWKLIPAGIFFVAAVFFQMWWLIKKAEQKKEFKKGNL